MRVQCRLCPWKKSTRGQIPNGFARDVHDLIRSMSTPMAALHQTELMMQCHETSDAEPLPCVGWMVHQLGPGNDLVLRMKMIAGHYDGDLRTVGPQHERFEDILIGTPYEVTP